MKTSFAAAAVLAIIACAAHADDPKALATPAQTTLNKNVPTANAKASVAGGSGLAKSEGADNLHKAEGADNFSKAEGAHDNQH